MGSIPSQQKLREWFEYKEGELLWLRPPRRSRTRARLGAVAGVTNVVGVRAITVEGAAYRADRLVWAWHVDTDDPQIEHIDGDKRVNRIENLCAISSDNQIIPGKSKIRGVVWDPDKQLWKAYLGERVLGHSRRLGSAYIMRLEAECEQASFL